MPINPLKYDVTENWIRFRIKAKPKDGWKGEWTTHVRKFRSGKPTGVQIVKNDGIIQSIRFDRNGWTMDEARGWLRFHKITGGGTNTVANPPGMYTQEDFDKEFNDPDSALQFKIKPVPRGSNVFYDDYRPGMENDPEMVKLVRDGMEREKWNLAAVGSADTPERRRSQKKYDELKELAKKMKL
jgi:hypothetical protein